MTTHTDQQPDWQPDRQHDWQRRLEESFGDGPALPDPAGPLLAGRRALRRRRTAVAASTLALLAVVGGAGFAGASRPTAHDVPVASAGGSSPTSSPSSNPTSSPTAAPALAGSAADVRTATDEEQRTFDPDGPHVQALPDGSVVVDQQWRVTRLDVEAAQGDDQRTWGVVTRSADGGETVWTLLDWRRGQTSSATWDPAGKAFSRFDHWVADQLAHPTQESPAHLQDGRLELAPGWSVVLRVANPDQASAYGAVGDQMAVELRDPDGHAWFALVSAEGASVVDPATLDHPTMSSFLDHVAAQGGNGEGLK
ncbi:MAG: hypothetical protein ACXVWV_11750 [Nocardioides sp.]